MTVGVYGKIAGQPDFLRVNAGAFSQAGLDLWFQEGVEAIRSAGASLPEPATAFLLKPAKSRQAFVGAFAQSVDAAGRSFPLVVFRSVAPPDLAQPFPVLLNAHQEFVRAAGQIAAAGPSLVAADLTARAEALDSPGLVSDSVGGSATRSNDESAQPLLAALGGAPAALAYAMRTFVAACDQAAKASARSAGSDGSEVSTVITVDAPAPTAAVRRLWLEMAQQRLGGPDACPSFIWTDEGPSGRLLLALGAPPAAMLVYLANPRHRGSRLWPLHTNVAVALEQAQSSLTAQQRQIIAKGDLSLRELGAAFA